MEVTPIALNADDLKALQTMNDLLQRAIESLRVMSYTLQKFIEDIEAKNGS